MGEISGVNVSMNSPTLAQQDRDFNNRDMSSGNIFKT